MKSTDVALQSLLLLLTPEHVANEHPNASSATEMRAPAYALVT